MDTSDSEFNTLTHIGHCKVGNFGAILAQNCVSLYDLRYAA